MIAEFWSASLGDLAVTQFCVAKTVNRFVRQLRVTKLVNNFGGFKITERLDVFRYE